MIKDIKIITIKKKKTFVRLKHFTILMCIKPHFTIDVYFI